MGQALRPAKSTFVAFQPRETGFAAFISLEGALNSDKDLQLLLSRASATYAARVAEMRATLSKIEKVRSTGKAAPARQVWRLGQSIFDLVADLAALSLELDGLYEHLVRDLGVKRKWLEKVIIFRRYLESDKYIPRSLRWSSVEKGTRRAAERLRQGLPLAPIRGHS
jgi:hypothetical protein